MRYLLLSFFLFNILNSSQVFAQSSADVVFATSDNYLLPEDCPKHYILADQVSMRDQPNVKAKLIAKLAIGSPLTILKRAAAEQEINGILSDWYEVETDGKTGWVWGGLIASYAFGSSTDATLKFVVGYDKIFENPETLFKEYYFQIRSFRDNVEVDRIVLKTFARQFGLVENLGAQGLLNVDDIIRIEIPCLGGCGCTGGEIIVFSNNDNLTHIEDLMGTADGTYSEHSALRFPADMEGRPHTIIKEISNVVWDEDDHHDDGDENDGKNLTRQFIQEFYKWDSAKYLPTGEAPIVKTYTIKG